MIAVYKEDGRQRNRQWVNSHIKIEKQEVPQAYF